MFESTLPMGAPELMRVSAFERYRHDGGSSGDDSGSGRLSSLSPSLMRDLLRFDTAASRPGERLEVLEVLAACVRHGSRLLLHLQDGSRVVPLTVFAVERLVHCPLPVEDILASSRLPELHVLQVEPAQLQPPGTFGSSEPALVGEPQHHAPLAPLLWELALRGAREELLPEIAGLAAYRIVPGVDLRGLRLTGTLELAVRRLQRATTNLREISEWPGFDRARAMRMLNGLYLLAGLMVTRSHPAATNDGWFSGSR